MTIVRSEVSFVPQVDLKIGDQFSKKINRDGVVISSNKFGQIYFALQNKLFITSIEEIEKSFDEGEDEHTLDSLDHLALFTLPEEISQLSLSVSELLLSICSGSVILICDVRKLLPNVTIFFFSTFFSLFLCRHENFP
jgi:hypothetical protein